MTTDPFNKPDDHSTAPGPTPFPHRAHKRPSALIPVLAVIAVALALAAVYVASRIAPAPSANQPRAAQQPQRSPTQRAQRTESPQPEAPTADPNVSATLIESAGEKLGFDHAEAVRRFEQALRAHADAWTSLNPEQNRAALDAAVRTLIRAGNDQDLADALARVLTPATRLTEQSRLGDNEVLPAVWAWSAIAHLAAIPELPTAARQAVTARRAALADAFATPDTPSDAFSAAAAAALSRVPALLVASDANALGDAGSQSAWRSWLLAVAVSITDPARRDAVLLQGAEVALSAASTLPPDQTTRAIITDILSRADWSERAPARDALVRWLDAPDRFSSRELATVLRWLSTRPTADVPPDALLRPDAAPEQRRAVRERLATVWRLQAPAMLESLAHALRAHARTLLDSPARPSAVDALSDAVLLTRLYAASERLRDADVDHARPIIENIRSTIDASASNQSAQPASLTSSTPDDGRWALRFLASRRNVAERRAAVADIGSSLSTMGPVDAEVLVEFALVGSPTDVRILAQRAVERRADEPFILNALLESLPSAPRNDATARLYQRAVQPVRLPPPRDPQWPVEARRALLARLLAFAPSDAELARIDRLAQALRAASLEAISPKSPQAARAMSDADPDAPFRARWAALRASASTIPTLSSKLDEIEARLRARRTIALGPAQHTVAQARALTEAHAATLILEQPSLAADALAILDAANDGIDAAPTTFHQIREATAAILKLSLLRAAPISTPQSTTPTFSPTPALRP